METFKGLEPVASFPAPAMDFYAGLAANNTKEWWLEHKNRYDADVRRPLLALLDALTPSFGAGQLFRPYRDMRYFGAQGPYKTSQSAFVARGEGIGYYLEVDAAGVHVSAGCRSFPPAQLARFRAAVDASASGTALAVITKDLTEAGFKRAGQALKTMPRGFASDHPRAELLKHKTFTAICEPGFSDAWDVPMAAGIVAERWAQLRPLVNWLLRYAPA